MKNKNLRSIRKKSTDEEFLMKPFNFDKAVKKEPITKGRTTSIRWDSDVITWLESKVEAEGGNISSRANSAIRKLMNADDSIEVRVSRLEKAIGQKKSS